MNVLKPQQKQTVLMPLEHQVSQHEIARKTGIDRKTIRKLAHAQRVPGLGPNSPMATGLEGVVCQTPPPRPPAIDPEAGRRLPAAVRSACEPHRDWIEVASVVGTAFPDL